MNSIKTIERYIWAVNLFLLFLIAYFSAGLVNLYLQKKISSNVELSPRVSSAVSYSLFNYHPSSSKIIERNLFGTTPKNLASESGEEGIIEQMVENINAEVMGIIYFMKGSQLNRAILKLVNENKTQIYKLGDFVVPGAKVEEIWARKVVLAFGGGRKQELDFSFGSSASQGTAKPKVAATEYVNPYTLMSPEERRRTLAEYRKGLGIDDRIQRLSENYYKIERSAIEQALSNMNAIVTQSRITPNFVVDSGGQRQVDGFKVMWVLPGGIFEKLGIQNGDLIKKINGAGVDNVEKGFQLLQQLRYEKKFELEILRGNRNMNLSYEILD